MNLFCKRIEIKYLLMSNPFFPFGGIVLPPKVARRPNLVGAGNLFRPQIQIWMDLGPMSFWSPGHWYWRGVYNTNVVGDHHWSYLVRLGTPTQYPWCPGGPNGGPVGFWSLHHTFWQKLYKTKVAEHPLFSEAGHLFGPQSPVCFWSCGASLSRGVYNIKIVMYIPNSYLVLTPNSFLPIMDD